MTAFIEEILAQGRALRDLTAFYNKDGRVLLDRWFEILRGSRGILATGMGTSEFSPTAVAGLFAQMGILLTTRDAGELLHYSEEINGLALFVSQSGESVETRKLAQQETGATRKIALTNNPDSAMAKACDVVLPMCAGHETAISTKTYVNTLGVLYLMAHVDDVDVAISHLDDVATYLDEDHVENIHLAATLIENADGIHFVSRGPSVVAAKQAALTFMEGARVCSAAFTGGAFRHGPFELAGAKHVCVLFIPEGKTTDLLENVAQELLEKGSRIVVITNTAFKTDSNDCVVLQVPSCGECLFPVYCAKAQGLLLHRVAKQRGLTAGDFRYGGKITSKE